jgi:hypothetical protein
MTTIFVSHTSSECSDWIAEYSGNPTGLGEGLNVEDNRNRLILKRSEPACLNNILAL